MTTYPPATDEKIAEVVEALERFGDKSIIALAGVPGTGKSYIASIAAQRFSHEPLFVREVQFHQSFSYEEFMEGLRIDDRGVANAMPGIFLDLNGIAADDASHRYVLLIEELTRANLSAVLGELLTYLEYRGKRPFYTVYSRKPVYVSENLFILATYNPMDRSAIEIDSALLRRLRVLSFPPDTNQLREMLSTNGLQPQVIDQLAAMFDACKKAYGDDYELGMPFGHGLFAEVRTEEDLTLLYRQRIRYILRRPLLEPHRFTTTIEKHYPWINPGFTVPRPLTARGGDVASAPLRPAAEGPGKLAVEPVGGAGAGAAANEEPAGGTADT
jgi:5-methylcytosine-specific restriction protein B